VNWNELESIQTYSREFSFIYWEGLRKSVKSLIDGLWSIAVL